MPPILALVTDKMVDDLARHLCASRNEEPEGTEHKFEGGGIVTVTFFEKARRDVRTVLQALDAMPTLRH